MNEHGSINLAFSQISSMQPSPTLTEFFNGLKAAIDVGVPLDVSSAKKTPDLLTRQRLDAFRATADDTAKWPPRLNAAIETWQRTGSIVTAIEGLSTEATARQTLRRATARTLLYLALVLATVAAAITLFWVWLQPEIDAIYRDLEMTTGVAYPNENNAIVFAILIIGCLIAAMWVLQQVYSGNSPIVNRFGGRQFVDYRRQHVLWSTLERLLNTGTPPDQASSLAHALLGGDQSLKKTVDARLASMNLPADSQPSSTHGQELYVASGYFSSIADFQIQRLRSTLSITTISIFGGALVAACAILMYYPVIRLLGNLAKATIV